MYNYKCIKDMYHTKFYLGNLIRLDFKLNFLYVFWVFFNKNNNLFFSFIIKIGYRIE